MISRAATDRVRIRPLEPADLDAVADLSAAAFGHELDDQVARRRWTERLAHPLQTDPGGAFVAEHDGRMIGLAEAIQRERLWVLSMLAVDPRVQSAGAGRALLERALRYGAECDAGLIISSSDPRALRLYGLAGFSLRPTFESKGRLDRGTLPGADPAVREADGCDLEGLAAISRAVRGAPHTSELSHALERGGRLLRHGDRGFAVAMPMFAAVWLLVARDPEAAQALLWRALELVGGLGGDRSTARWITGGQDWAIDVLLKAGYTLAPRGALCVRGRPGPLHPFLPSGPFA
ncbi:MAG TPA: GNAT family N-acetyltransferase [Solirubrobacteraceae bacterium]|nr:GNAT family N-acetyltransferase [Solirubrobacteraceae bacterium]